MEKIVVALLSVSSESCTDSFSKNITEKSPELTCRFVKHKLTKSDLQSFKPQEKYDAVILLHSVLQGRNSITDVKDAKYDKLLPLLKRTYGPSRVAVVVHSILGHNPGTKKALMMIFKQAQKTTFLCSNCIIQCNNPSEMPGEDVERLIKFLREVPVHALPVGDVETPHLQTNIKTEMESGASNAYSNQNQTFGGSSTAEECVARKSGYTLKSEAKTRNERSRISSGALSPKDQESSLDSGSNLGRQHSIQGGSSPSFDSYRHEEKSKEKHSGHKGDHSSEIPLLSKGIKLAYPAALVFIPNSCNSLELEQDIRACFKGKLFKRMESRKMLHEYWSKLEAILVNVGDRRHICEKDFLIAVKSSKDGKWSNDKIVEWWQEGANDVNCIECAVFSFSALQDLRDNTTRLTDVIDFLDMHQGRYPVAVITHIDVADEANVEGLSTYLHTTGVCDVFKVVSLTKEKPKLDDDPQRIILNLLNRCMANEQRLKIEELKRKEQEEKMHKQERRVKEKRRAAETMSMASQEQMQLKQLEQRERERMIAEVKESEAALQQERMKAQEQERIAAQIRENMIIQMQANKAALEQERVTAQEQESIVAHIEESVIAQLQEDKVALDRDRVTAQDPQVVTYVEKTYIRYDAGVEQKKCRSPSCTIQ